MTVVNPGGGGSSTSAFALGTAAARPAPAAGNNKTGYLATDTFELSVSDGAAWNAVKLPVAFGTAAARPAAAAGNNKTVYYATDTGEVTYSDGATWQTLAATSATTFRVPQNGFYAASGISANLQLGNGIIWVTAADLDIFTGGRGLRVAEGANAKQGLTAAMVAGTVTVANTSVTANSRILLTRAPGGANPGACNVSAIVAATSFTITSTNAADTGAVFFQIFEPG